MNSTATNVGGWAACEMREYLNNDIYNLLPTELRTTIKTAKKTSGDSYTGNLVETEDKLFLLSATEVCVRSAYYGYVEGSTYAIFGDMTSLNPADAGIGQNPNRIKASGYGWWTRSSYRSNATSFVRVLWNGTVDSAVANVNDAGPMTVCFGFCV